MKTDIKKGMYAIFKGQKVYVVYCSLNKVRIRRSDGKEKMVSYSQLQPLRI
jgi:hypothetical protein